MTYLVFKNMAAEAAKHTEVCGIGETLSPVASAAADIGKSLSCPHIHIEALVKSAGISIVFVLKMLKS